MFDWPDDGTSAFCESDADCVRWGQDPGNGEWGSGAYFHNGDSWTGTSTWPEAVLRSGAIVFPELVEGDVVSVVVEHTYALNLQDQEGLGLDRYVDYVELAVELTDDAKLESVDLPLGNWPIGCDRIGGPSIIDAGCVEAAAADYCENPLDRGAGKFPPTEDGELLAVYKYEVPAEDGWPLGDRNLRFSLRYDCTNFANGDINNPRPPDDAWTISSVRVSVSKGRR